jgi:hypothetical protein
MFNQTSIINIFDHFGCVLLGWMVKNPRAKQTKKKGN